MSAYVAVVAAGTADVALPEPCVAALALPGAGPVRRHAAPGFACAAAPTRPDSPGVHAEGGLVAVGDVRLDARADLLAALGAAAPPAGPAATHLALLLAAYAAWGEAAFGRLRGDFSFVLYDARRRAAFAVRDGLGVRPLYVADVAGATIVANVLDAVRAHPDVPTGLNPAAVASFLACGVNVDSVTTTFAGIGRLAPGTYRAMGPGVPTARTTRHWSIPDPAPLRLRRAADYVERYRHLLGEAVADRVDPAGTAVMLSGGIDSTSMAATARRVRPDARLVALTMRTTNVESPVEMELATSVARRLGIPHVREETPSAARPAELRRTPEPLDEPELAGHCARLSGLASAAGVVLEGEDGDALFRPAGLATMLRREPALLVLWRIAAYTVRHGRHPYLGFWIARRLGLRPGDTPPGPPAWLHQSARALVPHDTATVRGHRARPEAAASLSAPVWQALHASSDRAYHGAAVEFRWPFLDARLLEFVFAIPSVPWCQRKHLARVAFAPDLPHEVIVRPKTTVSGYFEAMVREWQERTGAPAPELDARTLEFVDPVALAGALRDADAETVMAAWRVLEFDHWVREAGVS